MTASLRMTRSVGLGLALLSIIMAGLRCGSDWSPEPDLPQYGVTPDSVGVEVSSSQQFDVTFESGTPDVAWYVDGKLGGRPATGMITPAGLYIAPSKVPANGFVTVSARSLADSTVQSDARVVLTGDGQTPNVEVAPAVVTVPVSDSVGFQATITGCLPGVVAWSIAPLDGAAAAFGSINENGFYTAPASPGADFVLMVTAESGNCAGKTGLAMVVVKQPVMFWIETEGFTDSLGTGITRNVSCGGGLGVTGLDAAGEWISIPFEVRAAGRYAVFLNYAAGIDDVLDLTLTADGCGRQGSSPQVTLVLDQGSGVGG
jgi:hypothetical protein